MKICTRSINKIQNDKLQCSEESIIAGTKLTKNVGGTAVDATLFKQIVGSLIYLTVTRPDIMYVVRLISRYMSRPTMSHWLAVKEFLGI